MATAMAEDDPCTSTGGHVRAGRRILCGIDGSECSRHAFRFALDKIFCPQHHHEDRVILLHVLIKPNIMNHPVIFRMTEEERFAAIKKAEDAARASLGKLLEESSPGVKCELVVAVGDPREQVSKYVTQHPVDMVVLGSRGMGNCKHSDLRFRLGSVSSHLAQHCPIPVTIVPSPEPPGGTSAGA